MPFENAQRCRICNKIVQVKYTMRSDKGEGIEYYLCECGAIFHTLEPKKFDKVDIKFKEERIWLFLSRYLPIIEEQSYGREMTSYGLMNDKDYLEHRGWIVRENKDKVDLAIVYHHIRSEAEPFKSLKDIIGRIRTGGLLLIAEPDTSLCMLTGYKLFSNWGADARTMTSIDSMTTELIRLGMEKRPLVSIQNISKRCVYTNDYHLMMRKGMIDEQNTNG